MLHTVSASAEEVACPTVFATRPRDMLRHLLEVYGLEYLVPKFLLLIHRVSAVRGKLLVCACAVVTDQTVHIFFRGEIKGVVLPSISRMATGTPAPVRYDGDSEVVDGVLLSDASCPFPCPPPVNGGMQLFGGLCMAFEAGLCHLLSTLKLLVELLELLVVSSRFEA